MALPLVSMCTLPLYPCKQISKPITLCTCTVLFPYLLEYVQMVSPQRVQLCYQLMVNPAATTSSSASPHPSRSASSSSSAVLVLLILLVGVGRALFVVALAAAAAASPSHHGFRIHAELPQSAFQLVVLIAQFPEIESKGLFLRLCDHSVICSVSHYYMMLLMPSLSSGSMSSSLEVLLLAAAAAAAADLPLWRRWWCEREVGGAAGA